MGEHAKKRKNMKLGAYNKLKKYCAGMVPTNAFSIFYLFFNGFCNIS
jgi:hypothetical protein